MKKQSKLNIGFIPVAANFFVQGNMFRKDSENYKYVKNDIDNMLKLLKKDHDVITSELITTIEESDALKEKFKKENVDVIIASNIMWSEDQLILNIVREFKDTPLAIWCFTPFDDIKDGITLDESARATGPCGTFQSMPSMFRLNKKLKLLFGKPDEEKIQKEIKDYLAAVQTVKGLKNDKIALIPSRWDIQTDTMIDESYLTNQIGPEAFHFSFQKLKKYVDKVADSEVEKYFEDIKKRFKVEDVRDEVIKLTIKASLGFRDLAVDNNMDDISYNENDPDLYELIGVNPCIHLDSLYENVKVIGMEGDLPSITMLLIFRYLTDKGIMFTEILTTDRKNNFILTGHPGNHNMNGLIDSDSDVTIVPDYEWKDSKLNIHGYEGAWMYFTARKGDLTLGQLIYHKDSLKMMYCRAKSLGLKIFDFYPQGAIEIPIPMDEFIHKAARNGCGHHWLFAYGDQRNRMKAVAGLLGIEAVDMEI